MQRGRPKGGLSISIHRKSCTNQPSQRVPTRRRVKNRFAIIRASPGAGGLPLPSKDPTSFREKVATLTQMLRLIDFQKIPRQEARSTVVLYVEERAEKQLEKSRQKLERTEH